MTLEDVIAVFDRHPEGATDRAPPLRRPERLRGHRRADRLVRGARAVLGDRAGSVIGFGGVAAALGRELTQPGVAQSVVLTRLAGRTAASMPSGEGVAALAAHGATMAVFLSAAQPDELASELLAPDSGYRPDTPAAIVVRATWPDEKVVRTTVGNLAADLQATGTTLTVLVLVGDALADGPSPGGRTSTPPPTPRPTGCGPNPEPRPDGRPPGASDEAALRAAARPRGGESEGPADRLDHRHVRLGGGQSRGHGPGQREPADGGRGGSARRGSG